MVRKLTLPEREFDKRPLLVEQTFSLRRTRHKLKVCATVYVVDT